MDEKKKKAIEEIASIICKETSNKGVCEKCDFKKHKQFGFVYQCSKFDNAEDIYNAGYRKESDTAREILKWLKSEVIMTEIPHGSEPCEEDVEAVMWWQIEEHFKKKYGVDLGE